MGSFEQALEHSLQELARTGDINASLQGSPEDAEALRPLLELAQAVRGHYRVVPEAPGGLTAGRERVLAEAASARAGRVAAAPDAELKGPPRIPRLQLTFPLRLATLTLVAILSVFLLGAGMVWAASDSLPGDLLHPIKLATEDLRWTLATEPADQVDLALNFVEERVAETRALALAGHPAPEGALARLEQQLDRALRQAAMVPDEEMGHLLLQVSEHTSAQIQVLEGVQTLAPEQTQAGLNRAMFALQLGAAAADEGLQDPQTFRWRYQWRQDAPESHKEPEQQRKNRESESDAVSPPEATPGVTRRAPSATSTQQAPTETDTPRATPHRTRATATLQALQATDTPHATPRDPQVTTTRTATPMPSQATTTPRATGQGPKVTVTPATTPVPPEASATPHAESPGPGPTNAPQAPQPTSGNPGGTAEPGRPGGGGGNGH
jgi:hypothetical protein